MDEDDFLGSARLDIDLAARGCSSIDTWVSLEGVDSGQVRLKLYWMPLSTKESDFRETNIRYVTDDVLAPTERGVLSVARF